MEPAFVWVSFYLPQNTVALPLEVRVPSRVGFLPRSKNLQVRQIDDTKLSIKLVCCVLSHVLKLTESVKDITLTAEVKI